MGIASMTLKPHGIPRAEWVRRFCDEIKRAAELAKTRLGAKVVGIVVSDAPEHEKAGNA